LVSDNKIMVLTRRELVAFFYSPMAYIVLFGSMVLGLVQAWLFINQVIGRSEFQQEPIPEPIIQYFFFAVFPVFVVIFAVPVLTMRLFSEEKRSGTLEVMLTAPVGEGPIVVSKFLAAFVFYLTIWLPWGLYLVGLRIIGGEPFDYRPALSFFIALACSGAGFVAMGLFFSSLTRNQIAAAILTFMGMMMLLGFYMLSFSLAPGSNWQALLGYVNFLELWRTSLTGVLPVRELLFHLSTAAFWLFLTVKVLEARKWS
jgi:ABC-type transport system involved in multi-copper enzyme maturation permease subunit